MKYKYILFDMDGTLIDSHAAVLATMTDTLEAHNLPPIPEDERTLGIKNVYQQHAHVTDPEELRKTHLKMQQKYFHKNTLFPKVKETLAILKSKSVPMALVTTGNLAKVTHLLKQLELGSFFDVVVTESDVENLKPHPEPFRKAAMLLGLSDADKKDMLMVGDTAADIQGAQNYGIDSVAVTHSAFGSSTKDLNPTHIIDHIDELLSIIGIE